MANCSEVLVAATLALEALNASYQELQVRRGPHRLHGAYTPSHPPPFSRSCCQVLYDEASAPSPDPCAYEEPDKFTLSLHIGGVFAVFFASALGAAIPLLSSLYPKFAIPPFAIVLGKCVGTGVILACGLIHMLLVSGG